MIAIAVGLIIFVTSVSWAGFNRYDRPELARALAPHDAQAQAGLAFEQFQGSPTAEALSSVERLSGSAFARDATNVAALRTLASVREVKGDRDRAYAFFRHVEKLSRRDLPTNLWMIEHEVQRGDVEGALVYFDRALRTSRSAPEILFPILTSAAEDPAIARALRKIMAARPAWWIDFLFQAIENCRSVTSLTVMSRGMLRPDVANEKILIDQLIHRLQRDAHYELAWQVYASAAPDAARENVRNGGFSQESGYPIFDWTLLETSEFAAYRQTEGPNSVLRVSFRAPVASQVANQLVHLKSGRYRLTARSGAGSGSGSDQFSLAVRCVDETQSLLASIPFSTEVSGRTMSAEFVTSAACPFQWLAVETAAGSEIGDVTGWLDDVRIVPTKAAGSPSS